MDNGGHALHGFFELLGGFNFGFLSYSIAKNGNFIQHKGTDGSGRRARLGHYRGIHLSIHH